MKKNVLIIIFLMTFALTAKGQEIHYDWGKLNIKGKVKAMSISEFFAIEESGIIRKNGKQKSFGGDLLFYFNISGTVDSLLNYSSEGTLFTKYSYFYDEKGYLVEIDKSYRKHLFKYNSDGQMIQEVLYNNPEGLPTNQYLFYYDDKRNMIEKHSIHYPSIDTSRNDILKTKCEYDAQGNLIKKQLFKKDSTNDFAYSYQYNTKGKMTEQTAYLSNGKMNYKETYQYDKKGNCIEIIKYNGQNEINTSKKYQYKFDEFGNWVEAVVFINSIPSFINVRTYKYY